MRHEVHILDMAALLEAVTDDVVRARRRVLVETYIFRDDRLGRAFGEQLARAAARGARVCLLYDPHGSNEADPWIFAALARRGVEVRPYRRIGAVLGSLSPALRNHSRLLVIDDAAYTGGFAWADEWLPAELGGGGWHDLACRVRGPVVEDFVALWERRWRESAAGVARTFDTGERYPDVRLMSTGPAAEPPLLRQMVEAFAAAGERIWIQNAYFFPTTRLLAALAVAARQGVDVRVTVPAHSDLPIIARAARAEYPAWLEAGINIFEYQPTVMHAKAALVDDHWCTIGTFNANPTAAHLSLETALLVRQRPVVTALAERFQRDLQRCRRVTARELPDRSLVDAALDDLAHAVLVLTERILEP